MYGSNPAAADIRNPLRVHHPEAARSAAGSFHIRRPHPLQKAGSACKPASLQRHRSNRAGRQRQIQFAVLQLRRMRLDRDALRRIKIIIRMNFLCQDPRRCLRNIQIADITDDLCLIVQRSIGDRQRQDAYRRYLQRILP